MASHKDHQSLYDRIAALREQVTDRLGADLISNPQLADALTKQIDDMLKSVVDSDAKTPPPPDQGLASLIGVGPEAAKEIGTTRIPPGVEPYDETITSERIMAVGDMYYLWQHEKIGVFRAVQKLQELFKAGTVRLSAGQFGLFGLCSKGFGHATRPRARLQPDDRPSQLGRFKIGGRTLLRVRKSRDYLQV